MEPKDRSAGLANPCHGCRVTDYRRAAKAARTGLSPHAASTASEPTNRSSGSGRRLYRSHSAAAARFPGPEDVPGPDRIQSELFRLARSLLRTDTKENRSPQSVLPVVSLAGPETLPSSSASTQPSSPRVPLRIFIREAMKPATKRLPGETHRAVREPIRSTVPLFGTTNLSAIVTGEVWRTGDAWRSLQAGKPKRCQQAEPDAEGRRERSRHRRCRRTARCERSS